MSTLITRICDPHSLGLDKIPIHNAIGFTVQYLLGNASTADLATAGNLNATEQADFGLIISKVTAGDYAPGITDPETAKWVSLFIVWTWLLMGEGETSLTVIQLEALLGLT